MAARPADDRDRQRIVESMLSSALPRSLDWVLAPAGNDEDARRTLSSWVISVALDFGTVFVDDGGGVLGGMPQPLLAEHVGPLYRRTKPAAPSRAVGGMWLYPAGLPVGCNARLNQLGRAVQLLMPPFRVERLTVGSISSGEEVWAAWLDHAAGAGRPALVIAGADDDDLVLQRLGFDLVAESQRARDGLPALRSWLRTNRG